MIKKKGRNGLASGRKTARGYTCRQYQYRFYIKGIKKELVWGIVPRLPMAILGAEYRGREGRDILFLCRIVFYALGP